MGQHADDNLFDYYDQFDDDGDALEDTVTCNRCGASGLHWTTHHSRYDWTLMEPTNVKHVCAPSIEGFETVV